MVTCSECGVRQGLCTQCEIDLGTEQVAGQTITKE